MDRRSLLTRALGLGAFAATTTQAALAARGSKRLAVLLYDTAQSWAALPPELARELAAFGWIEGTNLSVEWRYADADPALLRSHAARLVASAPDAIFTRGTPATRVLKAATSTIPILTGIADPVGMGFAETHARPGGNITGVSYAMAEASQKQVELIRTLVPKLSLLIIVWEAERAAFVAENNRPIAAATRGASLATRTSLVVDLTDLHRALRSDRGPGEVAAMIYALGDGFGVKAVAEAALAARMPAMFEGRDFVDAGGLASYQFKWENQMQRSAAQIDKVFRGEKPAHIPFELPTRSEFVLNRKTARLLGLALPQSLLLRADAIVD